MNELVGSLEEQKKLVNDSAEILRDLLIGIENLGENMKNIQKEMDYWRNPEVMEAEEELECLHDEVPLHIPASKRPENVTITLPEDPSPFPAQRQNLFPIGGLEGISAASMAQNETEVRPSDGLEEKISALRKPYPGAPVGIIHGDSVKMGFNFGQAQDSRPQVPVVKNVTSIAHDVGGVLNKQSFNEGETRSVPISMLDLCVNHDDIFLHFMVESVGCGIILHRA